MNKSLIINRLTIPLSRQQPVVKLISTFDQPTTAPVYDMHYPLEMGIVITGEILRYDNQQSYLKKTGDVWFNGMWEPHGIKITASNTKLLVLVIYPPWLFEMQFDEAPAINLFQPFTLLQNQHLLMSASQRSEVLQLADLICKIDYEQPLNRIKCRLYIQQLLLIIQSIIIYPATTTPKEPQLFNSIAPALDLVFSQQQLVTNDGGAKVCKLPTIEFIRLFEQLMGISFSKFSLRYRLNAASKALCLTSAPIKAIALDWGFTDASHFHHLFVKHFKTTPKNYRKELRQSSNTITHNMVNSINQ